MESCVEPETVRLNAPNCTRLYGEFDFRGLYQAHFDEIMRLVLRYGIGRHDAEDLTQRVFLVAYRQGAAVETIERPDAWLRAVAVRVIREHFRWWRVRRAASWVVELSWAGQTEDDRSPERDAVAGESLRQVRKVLRQMSEKLRDALVLLDIEGLSPHEAGELLGVPQNTLRSRRALAREEFKRIWQREEQHRSRVDE